MEKNKPQNELEKIKWMLHRSVQDHQKGEQPTSFYGDLTELNTNRTILDHVGKETLRKVAVDAIDLLETSVAVYEKNGDYAIGMFSSGWCQTLDSASRRLCGDVTNRVALESGHWKCHDSCWDCSRRALESGQVVDERCVGAINLYSIPIFAYGKPVGVISVGYGNPPEDKETIKKLAEEFNLTEQELMKQQRDYQKRPEYIVKMAKKKIHTSAELIGLIVESRLSEERLKQQSEELKAQNQEIVAMNEELKESEKEARRANQAKSEFLSNMSHEIRTPLNGILGFSEIVRDTKLDEDQQSFIDIIIKSANSLMEIINDILDLSKIEADKMALNIRKRNIRELLGNTLDIVTVRAEQKGLDIQKKISCSIPDFVEVDDIRLKQILLNLLSNAVKFTDQGSVELTVKRLAVDNENKKVKLLFMVKDTGIGIKKENLKIVFEAFHQENMSSTKRFGGTGLGLSISNRLLEKMGSTLDVESTRNVGTQFSFELELPFFEAKESNSGDSERPLTKSQSKRLIQEKKILIVEDNKENMLFIKTMIGNYLDNIKTIEAENGREAYKLFKRENPDLILMDLVMPVLDGYQATTMIRLEDGEVPIVALTAKAMEGEREECLTLGMNDYLSKPVSIKRLRKAIERYLGRLDKEVLHQ